MPSERGSRNPKRKKNSLQQQLPAAHFGWTTCLADKTNHPVVRLSLNRSQCGSCSTKYDTPEVSRILSRSCQYNFKSTLIKGLGYLHRKERRFTSIQLTRDLEKIFDKNKTTGNLRSLRIIRIWKGFLSK